MAVLAIFGSLGNSVFFSSNLGCFMHFSLEHEPPLYHLALVLEVRQTNVFSGTRGVDGCGASARLRKTTDVQDDRILSWMKDQANLC